MIALIDYGAGNLTSVRKGFAAVGADLVTPAAPTALTDAAGVVVPGVGHFLATRSLETGWLDAIRRGVDSGRPLLGICLGMQWLFDGSTESPGAIGLGALAGRCERLDDARGALKVPHVGWNALEILRPSWILDGLPSGEYVYFTHSYAAPVTAATVAAATHGDPFAAVVERDHIAGVQFHPEKSGPAGLRILRNFVERCRA